MAVDQVAAEIPYQERPVRCPQFRAERGEPVVIEATQVGQRRLLLRTMSFFLLSSLNWDCDSRQPSAPMMNRKWTKPGRIVKVLNRLAELCSSCRN